MSDKNSKHISEHVNGVLGEIFGKIEVINCEKPKKHNNQPVSLVLPSRNRNGKKGNQALYRRA